MSAGRRQGSGYPGGGIGLEGNMKGILGSGNVLLLHQGAGYTSVFIL